MAIMDLKLELSDAQTICFTDTQTGTASTNLLDLGAAKLAIGAGTPLYLNIRVCQADFANDGTTASITFNLHASTGAAFGITSYVMSRKVIQADLTAGSWIMRVPIPSELERRYLRLRYVNSNVTTGFTAGQVDSWISAAVPETNVGT